jgi:hypothetical protein
VGPFGDGREVFDRHDWERAVELLADAAAKEPGSTRREAARARVLVAEAHRASGKLDMSKLELRAALAAFERLGAWLDPERIDRRLAGLA